MLNAVRARGRDTARASDGMPRFALTDSFMGRFWEGGAVGSAVAVGSSLTRCFMSSAEAIFLEGLISERERNKKKKVETGSFDGGEEGG